MLSQYRKSILWVLLFVVSASCYAYAHDRGLLVDEYYDLELVGQSEIHEDNPVTQFTRANFTSEPQVVEVSYITQKGFGWSFGGKWLGFQGFDVEETVFTDTITIPPWTSVTVISKNKWQYSHYRGYRVEVYWCYEHNTYEYERFYLGDKDWKEMWTEVWYVEHELLQPVSTDPVQM